MVSISLGEGKGSNERDGCLSNRFFSFFKKARFDQVQFLLWLIGTESFKLSTPLVVEHLVVVVIFITSLHYENFCVVRVFHQSLLLGFQ